jgi:predicted dehydrogenase/aryl-alcohol dehydrogenase-like predicted oxidoreductase
MMAELLRWGIIGTGAIAHAFAEGLARSRTGKLIAVGSRTQESADRFADEFSVPRRHGSYEALLADSAVVAVYVSTPHPFHAQWAIRAAEAGKHILCEKPLTINHAEAMAVVEAAREHDVFLMEAFMYRCHPQTAKLVELIQAGVIGEVGVIQATFSFRAGFNAGSRLFKQALGGGGILDVGCYCTSMARLIAGAAIGKDFAEPIEVKGTGHLGKSRVDDYAIASLKFPNGILAHIAAGVHLSQENVVRIFGSEGRIHVPTPWIPSREAEPTTIVVHRVGKQPEEIVVESDRHLYTMEADTVARYIERRQAAPPAMTWDDTLGNMRTLDAWRSSIGLVYDVEKPGAQRLTATGRPLAVRPDSKMKYGDIVGVEKPVARLAMGTMGGSSFPHAAAMFDHYFEQGGNCFDTAYIYGSSDATLGQWINSRGVRERVAVIAKGAHSPDNRPEVLRRQLERTLERMGTGYADIHLAHRDNPEIPVGEWAEAWNELLREGLIRAYGGSNWALARVEELNEYARANGLVGMACVSNQLSLARMVHPVWEGCIGSSDAESQAWLTRTQLPILAWSSQARGFFTERSSPENLSDAEMVSSWYAEDNFRRKARAEELAFKRGVAPIVIALAYVLCQPFPTFALIGPATLAETRQSMEALELALIPEELRWLNLEAA